MDSEGWLQLAVVVFGLALVTLAAMAETAVSTLSRARVQQLASDGMERARVLTRLFEEPGIYSATVVIIRTTALILAATLATAVISRFFIQNTLVVVLALVGFCVVTIYCQLIFKALTARVPDAISLAIARPLWLISMILRPLVQLFAATINGLLRLFGVKVSPLTPIVTEQELRLLVNMGGQEGIIEEEEKDMIDGILELEETTAREIMVPRIDIFALEACAKVTEAVEAIISESYSRIPVYQGNIDNIIGILYARDLFKPVRDGKWTTPVKEIVRPAYYIPHSKRINELLRELKQRQTHIAIVVDEYGGTAGLVTIEDLLEEIVGEIQDEFDIDELKVEQVSDNEAIFDATISIDDVNETLSINLESDVDSIGGYVYDKLGKIPTAGDSIQVDGVGVVVLSTEGQRIKKVRVTVDRPATETIASDQL